MKKKQDAYSILFSFKYLMETEKGPEGKVVAIHEVLVSKFS